MKGNGRYLLTLICCCLLAASSVGIFTNSVGVFYSPVSGDLGVGRGAFALHATLCALVMGFLCPLAAKLLKRFPFRPLLLSGAVLAAGSTALMATAQNVWTFYVLGILRGIGMTMFSLMPVTTIINNWFREKHGLAVGIALSFSGIAGAVFSPLLSGLIQSLGWRNAFLWMAAFGFVLTIPGLLFLEFDPRRLHMDPYGGPAPTHSVSGSGNGKLHLPTLAVLSLMTVLHTSVTGIAQHFPGMAEWLGWTAQVGAAMVSAGMIGNIVSKLMIGTLSDRIGPFKASMCMISVNAVALLGLLLLGSANPVLLYGAAFLYGAVYAVGAVGIPLLTRRLFGQENYASAYSVITIFTSIGSASSLTIIGLIYDLTGGYSAALIIGLAIDAINTGILLFLMHLARKRQALA